MECSNKCACLIKCFESIAKIILMGFICWAFYWYCESLKLYINNNSPKDNGSIKPEIHPPAVSTEPPPQPPLFVPEKKVSKAGEINFASTGANR